MVDIGFDESSLLIGIWVPGMVTDVRSNRVVIVVCPLAKVVGKLEPSRIRCCVLEVNDNQLLMLVCRLQKRRAFIVGLDTKNVAVLSLYKEC